MSNQAGNQAGNQEEAGQEAYLMNKQNSLIQQLLAQQHELKRLESKQQELMQLKKLAEGKLVAANKTANNTIQVEWGYDRVLFRSSCVLYATIHYYYYYYIYATIHYYYYYYYI